MRRVLAEWRRRRELSALVDELRMLTVRHIYRYAREDRILRRIAQLESTK